MTQQVNLYQPILRREKKIFSAVTMLQTLAVIGAVMLALFAISRWQLERLEEQRENLLAQERELATRFTEFSRTLQERPESRELRRRVELAQRELDLKQRLLGLMQERSGDGESNHGGFAAAFAGLARQRVQGLWLTGIELEKAEDRRDVTLRGLTARAELVPQLVQRLGEEPAFRGLRFEHLRVFQPAEAEAAGSDGALAFELTTRAAPEESK